MVWMMTERIRPSGDQTKMGKTPLSLTEFRRQIQEAREKFPHLWEASRKYLAPEKYRDTLPWLSQEIRRRACEPYWSEQALQVLHAFRIPQSPEKSQEHHQILKDLTGLPPSKAIRALIVWGLSRQSSGQSPDSGELSSAELQEILRQSANPYDLLFHAPAPSLLDIGAGDLTFEQELVEYYGGKSSSNNTGLIVHAFDRLNPGSKVGGVYHRNQDRERILKNFPAEELEFRFWGDMGLEGFAREKKALPQYTMVTCHAPANPTFAYEPSRLSSEIIENHLRLTRGEFNRARFHGESVLEVAHRGQVLTFPHWKFEILGPRRLLKFMVKRASVGVLSAVDDEVFWETLCQLLDEDRYRPPNQILTVDLRREVFGDLYDRLQGINPGERLDLSTVANLRTGPFLDSKADSKLIEPGRLAYVEIRRGAVLPGVPSSFTARQFEDMREEHMPWWIIFIPDLVSRESQ